MVLNRVIRRNNFYCTKIAVNFFQVYLFWRLILLSYYLIKFGRTWSPLFHIHVYMKVHCIHINLKDWTSYDFHGPSKLMLYLLMKWDLVLILYLSPIPLFLIWDVTLLAEFFFFRKNHTEYCFHSIPFWRECLSSSGDCSTFNITKLGTWICNLGTSHECCMYMWFLVVFAFLCHSSKWMLVCAGYVFWIC